MKMGSKKPLAALIIAKMKPKDEHGSEEESSEHEAPSDEPSEGHMAAAQEMMDALKKGDKEEFAEALHSFIEMCY